MQPDDLSARLPPSRALMDALPLPSLRRRTGATVCEVAVARR